MPKLNPSNNLNDFSQSRRYQLLKRIKNSRELGLRLNNDNDVIRKNKEDVHVNIKNNDRDVDRGCSGDETSSSSSSDDVQLIPVDTDAAAVESYMQNYDFHEDSSTSDDDEPLVPVDGNISDEDYEINEGNVDADANSSDSASEKDGDDDEVHSENSSDSASDNDGGDDEVLSENNEPEENSQSTTDDESGNENENYSGTDEEENDDEFEYDGNQLLYDGARITMIESMISIFTYMLTHNLTGAALADLLSLIYLHMLPSDCFQKTVYKFFKYFKSIRTPLVKHFYCSKCMGYLENGESVCNICDENPEKCYFIEIPILDQLQNLLLKPGFTEDLSYRYNSRVKENIHNIEDIYDGNLYQEHVRKNNPQSDKYNLSFMWYTDGAPVFKSTKYKIWPFCLTINELPYQKRILRENIMVAGLWFGPSDPPVNVFLRPIYTQLVSLNAGVNLRVCGSNELREIKAFLLCGTCDTPARADFLSHIRFNGSYGCPRCFSSGYNIRGEDFGNTHIYPFEGNLTLRTKEGHEQHARLATVTGKPQYGVNGPTILSRMMPDVIRGTAIDVMHCVYLGVVKKITELWLDSSLKNENFSIEKLCSVIDSRLKKIKPPRFIKRMPRSLSDHSKYWKASEWKAWFFYYSVPILQDIMKPVYFKHYLQLVLGIYFLNQRSVSYYCLNQSKTLLTAFVSKFQVLYGPRYMSFNVHSLLHLPELVIDLGPLWVTSCFIYEDLLGSMKNFVHGTRYVGLQISAKISYNSIICNLLCGLDEESDVKKFCDKLRLKKHKNGRCLRFSNDMYAMGEIKRLNVITPDMRVILDELEIDPNNLNIWTFKRLKKGNRIYYARSYTRKTAFSSQCVLVATENGSEIGYAESFIKICNCENNRCSFDCENGRLYMIYYKCIVRTPFNAPLSMSIQLQYEGNESITNVPYLCNLITEDNIAKLISVECIRLVCFVIEVQDSVYFGLPGNTIEYDY